MTPETYAQFEDLVYQQSGITLGPGKIHLVRARLASRMRTLDLHQHEDYFRIIVNDGSGRELDHLIDSIATNVTSFYRETTHFDYLAALARASKTRSQPEFRVWCAASATGEEAYSAGMTLLNALDHPPAGLRVLGSDISTRALETARHGVYGESCLKPVPPALRDRFFTRAADDARGLFTVTDELRHIVTFARVNLAAAPIDVGAPFDVIFCRNVMIYFDAALRRNLVLEICRHLKPGGYLMIGYSESVTGMGAPLTMVAPSIYQKTAS